VGVDSSVGSGVGSEVGVGSNVGIVDILATNISPVFCMGSFINNGEGVSVGVKFVSEVFGPEFTPPWLLQATIVRAKMAVPKCPNLFSGLNLSI
jgi:hypothetical protein